MRKICCFAGHSEYVYSKDLKDRIFKQCVKLVTQHDVNEFWVGNYGHFDFIAAKAVWDFKNFCSFDIELNLVVPYLTKKITDNKEFYDVYDNILIADIPENTPKRYQILKCNEYIIDNAQYLIAYVNNSFGGAFKTLAYAKRKSNIEIFNLGSLEY